MKRLVAFALLLLASDAHAYVRARTEHSGLPTRWASSCVLIQPDSVGTPDLDSATMLATFATSMQAWRDATSSCSYMTLDDGTPAVLEAHFDGINTIKFRTDVWCHPDDAQSNDVCYSQAAAGITTVFYVDKPGESDDGVILDADVELNDIDFTFAVLDPSAPQSPTPRTGTSIADLENTLVHELGHVQGLDHTCRSSLTVASTQSSSNEVDQNGDPPPDCATLDTLPLVEKVTIEDATMYAVAAPGETKKRSPEPDDVAGICNAYPLASAPKTCKPADLSAYKKGCDASAGDRTGSGGAGLVLLGLLIALARRWRVQAQSSRRDVAAWSECGGIVRASARHAGC